MACYPCTWQVPMLSLLAHILLLASSSVSIYHVNDDLSVLLSFKYYIKNDPGQALSSWDATDNGTNNLSTDFCRWNGIACNDHRHPGRVTAIRLRGSDLGGTISPHIGTLPVDIGRLRSLQVLDLSHNRFEGQIPQSLGNITGLSKLCISNNYLNGTIPTSLGNSMLCGGPPFLQFPSCASVHSQHRMHLLIVFCIPGTLIFLLFSITTYCCIKRRVKPNIVYQENLFLSEAHERISYNQLRSATQSFSPANLIGSGSFGNVYIGTFIIDENLATVAIKVINLNLRGASRSFLTECNALRRIRHRNLVKVITVCSGLDHNGDEFKALVLEFICNGSLDEWLHPNTMENSMTAKRLSLMRRLCIALDVAVALEYLHHNIEPPIVHSDIKPSNILLDDDLVAHVTDFGLAKIMYAEVWNKNHGDNESSSLAVKGTIGYVPPEYGSGYGVSTDGDIYSYGVLLLEMLTGKRPTDSFDHGTSLVSYVKMAYPNKLLEILDVSATYSGNTQDVIDLVIHPMFGIALACCQDSPRLRIKMDYVVEELKAIKKACAALMGS
uniref:Receptor kinase-like protein Xa21 n=1 Tax=Setaria viridis TaxID=4556 RepID=A0A4V6D8E4_SETVI|nr:hypothetical protein SEVIR_4G145700v2 [Setaria viridis]